MKNIFLPKKFKGLLGDIMICSSLMAIFGFMVVEGLDAEFNRVVKYNCEIAEISPDFTPAMKQECRKLRVQNQRYHT